MNQLIVIGNLGKDAKANNVGGTSVLNFSVAMKSGYGDKAQTIWIDCALWGKQAEGKLVDYLKKGTQVGVSGEMGTREHEGKTYITMRVDKISLCGGRDVPSEPQPQTRQAAPQPQQSKPVDDDDSIPF
jgi:single-strand DNA-binding protein